MDLVKRDIREAVTDIICIRQTISLLPAERREEVWEFILEQISGSERFVTKEQLEVMRGIFDKVKERES
uniref:Uncharacterized protein n=1 Tax=Marseillevirus LCMAC101 TaxID=2506602 RepID=A0A481YTZ2_9VIRU|nr:MAG: hypothetical protein LCMAC101_05610 [Marseillevirus LCMAC101]